MTTKIIFILSLFSFLLLSTTSCKKKNPYPELSLNSLRNKKIVLDNKTIVYLNKHHSYNQLTTITMRVAFPPQGALNGMGITTLAEYTLTKAYQKERQDSILDIEQELGAIITTKSSERYLYFNILITDSQLPTAILWLKNYIKQQRNISTSQIKKQLDYLNSGVTLNEYIYSKAALQVYGDQAWLPKGTKRLLDNLPLEKIKEWIQSLYYGENIDFFLSGNINIQGITPLLNNTFGTIPLSPQPFINTATVTENRESKNYTETIYLDSMQEYNDLYICRIKNTAGSRAIIAFRQEISSDALYVTANNDYIYLLLTTNLKTYFKPLNKLNGNEFFHLQGIILDKTKKEYLDPKTRGITFFENYKKTLHNQYSFIHSLQRRQLFNLSKDLKKSEHHIKIKTTDKANYTSQNILDINYNNTITTINDPTLSSGTARLFFFCLKRLI